MFDLVVSGATVVDGLGAAPYAADIAVQGGRIAAIESQIDPGRARQVLDAVDRLVTPGIVDLHTHSDLTVLAGPGCASKIHQGVTTEVVGNCGLGLAPRTHDADHHAIRTQNAYLDLDPGLTVDWLDIDGYLARVAAAGPALNVATLVPHLPLRASVIGLGPDPSTSAHRHTMAALLDEALGAGAVGVSTGLVYAPLCFADEDELLMLGRTVADRGGLFAWHVRDYGDELLPSVAQALDIGRRTGCRTQISHLVAVGRRNWGSVERALELVDEAAAAGLDVGVDVYPYLAGNCPLAQLLPADVQEGGAEVYQPRLRDRSVRAGIIEQWSGNALGWDEVVLNDLPDPALVGRTVADVAEASGRSGDDAALDLLAEHGAAVMIVAFGRSEDDLRRVLTHPRSVVASDGQALDADLDAGLPHPRSYGCFPRYLAHYADDLVDGIRRCTSAPADRAGLTDRGRLLPGAAADLAVLDLAHLTDTAEFTAPRRLATGVEALVVNGVLTLADGRTTGHRAGRALVAPPAHVRHRP